MPSKIVRNVHHLLLCIASNEALYLFVAFLSQFLRGLGPLYWYQPALNSIYTYIAVPWGSALCLLRLERRVQNPIEEKRPDLAALAALLVWIVLPFAYRFGLSVNNVTSWYNHFVVFFGLYALITEDSAEHRARLLDCVGGLFAALSFVLGSLALLCVVRVQGYGVGIGEYPFGIYTNDMLYLGAYYNMSGIVALCCGLLALIGVFRRKSWPARLLHLIPALMMMAVVVLTQSRTARYSMLVALALGCYGALASGLPVKRRALRQVTALLAAALVLTVGYTGARELTDAALAHFASVRAANAAALTPLHQEIDAQEPTIAADSTPSEFDDNPSVTGEDLGVQPTQQREAFNFSFQGRTEIWNSLFSLWKQEPKFMLMGYGMGNTGMRLRSTLLPDALTVELHNSYLQFAADYGLIGFALLGAFLLMAAVQWLHVFFAPKEFAQGGDRVLCMLVAAMLIFGLMESSALGAMQPVNLVLFFALALITARGRELCAAQNRSKG